MRISEVKALTQVEEPHFFDRDTLKFFGQRMSDFRVKRSPAGRVYIYAPIRLKDKIIGYTFREVIKVGPTSAKFQSVPSSINTLIEILEYIREN